MSWARIDDNLTFHPKVLAAGNAAIGVWIRMMAWSANHLTDGVVPGDIIRLISGRKGTHIVTLVNVGLVDQEGDVFTIHDYLDYNKSRAEILGKREKDADRKRDIPDGVRAESERSPSGVASESNPPIPSHPKREIEAEEIANLGFSRFNALGGTAASKILRLAPISQWEWDHALATDARSWGYVAKVIESMREEESRPKPPKARSAPNKYDQKLRPGVLEILREDDCEKVCRVEWYPTPVILNKQPGMSSLSKDELEKQTEWWKKRKEAEKNAGS